MQQIIGAKLLLKILFFQWVIALFLDCFYVCTIYTLWTTYALRKTCAAQNDVSFKGFGDLVEYISMQGFKVYARGETGHIPNK